MTPGASSILRPDSAGSDWQRTALSAGRRYFSDILLFLLLEEIEEIVVPKSDLALLTTLCLIAAAPVAVADRQQEGAERQQAVEHQREVHRMKARDQENASERRRQAEKDRSKVKEHAHEQDEQDEQEEGLGNDLDEDGVDNTQ
jgi:hypothetical protein